jgi:hypothetical protein
MLLGDFGSAGQRDVYTPGTEVAKARTQVPHRALPGRKLPRIRFRTSAGAGSFSLFGG